MHLSVSTFGTFSGCLNGMHKLLAPMEGAVGSVASFLKRKNMIHEKMETLIIDAFQIFDNIPCTVTFDIILAISIATKWSKKQTFILQLVAKVVPIFGNLDVFVQISFCSRNVQVFFDCSLL